jgi:hypothetical protein
VKAGLAIEAEPDSDKGIVIEVGWGAKQVNAFLRNRFQQLFAFLDELNPGFNLLPNEPDGVGTPKTGYTLPYVLLRKDRKKYHLVDIAHPTAEDYKEHTANGSSTSGFRTKGIFLGTS